MKTDVNDPISPLLPSIIVTSRFRDLKILKKYDERDNPCNFINLFQRIKKAIGVADSK